MTSTISATGNSTTVSVTATGSGTEDGVYDQVQAKACLVSNAADCKIAECPKADTAASPCTVEPLTTGAEYSLTAVLLKSGVAISTPSAAADATPLFP